MPDDFITADYFVNWRDNLFGRLEDSASTLHKELEALTETLASYEVTNAIEKATHMFAMDYLSNIYKDVVRTTIMAACMESVEYNYDLYVNHLLTAVDLNLDGNMIVIDQPSNYDRPAIRVDLSVLGSIDQWADAVVATREAMGMGKMHSRDIGIASEKWARYIYGVDREGRTVTRTKKVKGEGGESKTETVDVTDKYRGKYRETITTRLSLLPVDKAPFWYLLEHGNTGGGMGDGGTPYPAVHPLYMERKIKAALILEFKNAYDRFKEEAEDIISNTIREDFDLSLGDYEEIDDDYVVKIDKEVLDIIEKRKEELPEFTGKEGLKSVRKLKFINGEVHQFYGARGNQLYRIHGQGGRFVKQLRE